MVRLNPDDINTKAGKKLKYRKKVQLQAEDLVNCLNSLQEIREQVEKRLVGQKEMLDVLFLGLLTGGHVLLQGLPGLGKSTAIQSFCETLHAEVGQVQRTGEFIGNQVMVIDELDQCTPDFRRALLTAMQERIVVIDEEVYYLDQPFLVYATMNPDLFSPSGQVERKLSPAEFDRFLLFYEVPFPSASEEESILKLDTTAQLFQKSLPKLLGNGEILQMQRLCSAITVNDDLAKSIVRIAQKTRQAAFREEMGIRSPGISPRSSLYLAKACKAQAFLQNRTQASFEDLLSVGKFILRHRLVFETEPSCWQEFLTHAAKQQ